jgi:hypothetical protein
MNRSEKLPHRSRQVPTVDSDLDSPTPRSKSPGGNFDDDAASNYESSAEDKPVTPAAHTLLTEDPFSTEISKILFESIGSNLILESITDNISINNLRQINFGRMARKISIYPRYDNP